MKKNWVFLRGFARGQGHWANFADLFQAQFPQDSFEMIDLPGNGSRFKERSPWQAEDYVDLLRTECKALQNGEKVQILALSFGAMISIEWANRYPDEINKMYLVCTSTRALHRFYQRLMPVNFLRFAEILKAPPGKEQEKAILKMVSQNPERSQKYLDILARYSKHHPVSPQNQIAQLTAAAKFSTDPAHPEKIIWIGSWGDRMVSPQCTLSWAQKYKTEPRMHPWSGHDIPLDDPDWLIKQLQD